MHSSVIFDGEEDTAVITSAEFWSNIYIIYLVIIGRKNNIKNTLPMCRFVNVLIQGTSRMFEYSS